MTPRLLSTMRRLVLKRHHGPFTALCGSNDGIAEGISYAVPQPVLALNRDLVNAQHIAGSYHCAPSSGHDDGTGSMRVIPQTSSRLPGNATCGVVLGPG